MFVLGLYRFHIRLEVVRDRVLPRISGYGECSLGRPSVSSLTLKLVAVEAEGAEPCQKLQFSVKTCYQAARMIR